MKKGGHDLLDVLNTLLKQQCSNDKYQMLSPIVISPEDAGKREQPPPLSPVRIIRHAFLP